MKHLKTYEDVSKGYEIVYTFKTKANTGKYEYNVRLLQGNPKYDNTNGHSYNGLIISIDKTPGSWYVSTFLHHNEDDNREIISIDGDNWICINRVDIVKELKYWLDNVYPIWKDLNKYNL